MVYCAGISAHQGLFDNHVNGITIAMSEVSTEWGAGSINSKKQGTFIFYSISQSALHKAEKFIKNTMKRKRIN